MPAWPAGLPQALKLNGFGFSNTSGVIRTSMDAGPAFQRKRFTATPERVSGSLSISVAQFTTLDDFIANTLSGGALAFDWIHPITQVATSMRFVPDSPPAFAAVGGGRFEVQLTIEILP